ncbi:hypothetical protein DSCW_05390 [Desulfosarcina widdelii]|uniref:Uncharacterized protein n=1 Tax=Desulfosarcina widdelii TaxID=947919 RepID=A0A5K7YTF2_9BACT|nr:hypothetical protein [Desulfosarcina widdelii]BBO73122.1 hypothetical protein DSCW_05390 [Desulfosarcina widdelii]
MLFAARHRKDRTFDLREDEVTSCIFGPLLYMSVREVWALFRAWLPFDTETWPTAAPTDVKLSFWPNLRNEGRTEPDIVARFVYNGETTLTVLFEIKWNSPISGMHELVNQWVALPDDEKKSAFHVYLVKDTGLGSREIDASLTGFPDKSWSDRLICIGWRSLIEVLLYHLPNFGSAMNLWADGVIAFLRRRGQTVFTGFEWLAGESVFVDIEKEIFWRPPPWFLFDQRIFAQDAIFWMT